MKRIILSVAAVIAVAMATVSCNSDDNNTTETIIQEAELPVQAKSFIDSYFGSYTVLKIERDTRSVEEYYEVHLTDGTQIDFDKEGVWTEVDGNGRTIPTGFIHPQIVAYITANHPTTSVESIGKEVYGFNVDLLNNLDLRFNGTGDFLGMEN